MMPDRQIILLSAADSVDHVAGLFKNPDGTIKADVIWANGQIPEPAQGRADAVAISTDAEWCDATCRLLAQSCKRVRWCVCDLSTCTTNAEAIAALKAAGINEFTLSAPQADPATSLPLTEPVTPAVADPDHQREREPAAPEPNESASPQAPDPTQNAPESDSSLADDWTTQVPAEGEETLQRTVRTASALKRAAFESGDREPGEWPEPADFWGVTELPEFLPQYLPPAIEPYVTDQASRAGLDPAQVALNCYVACAALIRTGIELQMQDETGDGRTWKEKPILWGAVVGDPSTGKGPALDIALHKFFKIASALRQKDEAAWERYETDAKIHERRMQEYITAAVKNPQAVKPDAPEKPPKERLWTDDVTKEVVAKLLTENPRGKIAIIKDELASWFGGFDAYGNGKSDKDRPDWLSFYESKERYIDRAMEGRSYHVPSWGGIILGGIQPEVLARISGKLGADGMLQRFQIIVSKQKRQVPKRAADAGAVKDWNRILENLAAMQPSAHPVRLSAEAAAYMDEQAQWIAETMQAGFAPPIVAALGKWEGLFGRLMIVSHCIECAAQGLGHPSLLVSLRTAEQAWGWMRWILWPHAVHFYSGSVDQGEEFKSGKAFAEYVLAREIRKVRPHTLTSGWSHYRYNYKTIQARREFWARIEQSGWARQIGIVERTSSLAHEYEINPLVFDGRFTERSAIAQATAERYRQAMHPAMLAAQGREPGQD